MHVGFMGQLEGLCVCSQTFEAHGGSAKLVACLRHATSHEDAPMVQGAVSLLAELSGLSGLREALGLAGVIEGIVDLLSDAGFSWAGNPNDINPEHVKERAATSLVLLTSGAGGAPNRRRLRDAGVCPSLIGSFIVTWGPHVWSHGCHVCRLDV